MPQASKKELENLMDKASQGCFLKVIGLFDIIKSELGWAVVAHTFNSSTQETAVDRLLWV